MASALSFLLTLSRYLAIEKDLPENKRNLFFLIIFRGYTKEYWPTKLFSHSVAFIVNFNQTSSNVLKCTLFT